MKELKVLNNESKSDLIKLQEGLEFINNFEIHVHDAIDIINKIKNSSWVEIQDWYKSLITDYNTTSIDKFTLELIDKYCSNIDNEL